MKVPREIKSAAISFNTGVDAVLARQQAHGQNGSLKVKADDDTLIMPGTFAKLWQAAQEGYDISAPQTSRSSCWNTLTNP